VVTADGAKFSEMDRHLASIHTSNALSTWYSKCVVVVGDDDDDDDDDDDGPAVVGRPPVPS
jgi:hypothetical protein